MAGSLIPYDYNNAINSVSLYPPPATPNQIGGIQTFTDPAATAAANVPVAGTGTDAWSNGGVDLRAESPNAAAWRAKLGLGGTGGTGGKSGFGFNTDTMGLALGGLQTIAGIWQAWEANKLAKEQLKMQTQVAQANLTGQISAYNTVLDDRIANRVESGGWSDARGDEYLAGHKLDKVRIG